MARVRRVAGKALRQVIMCAHGELWGYIQLPSLGSGHAEFAPDNGKRFALPAWGACYGLKGAR